MTRTKKFKHMKIPFHHDCLVCQKCILCPIQWDSHIQSNRHVRELKHYKLRIRITEAEVKEKKCLQFEGEKVDTANDLGQEKVNYTNYFGGEVENGVHKQLHLAIQNQACDVVGDENVTCGGGVDFVNIQLLENMEEQSLSNDEKIIRSFRTKGISIPSSISKVCKVQKRRSYIKTSDFLEITENCILVDADELVGLVIFDFLGPHESQDLAVILFNLCKTSRIVKRSNKFKMNYQFMHGARVCNGKFDQYKQSVKPSGGGCLPGKQPPSATNLDYIANNITNTIYKHLKMHLISWTQDWENIMPTTAGTSISRLGNSPFTTMATTLNFHVNVHYDESDTGFGVISWFDRFFNSNTCSRTQFQFMDYGVYFRPLQGTLTIFKVAELKHQTIRNEGYAQLGLALALKKKVLEASERHLESIGFGRIVDPKPFEFLFTYKNA